MEELQKKHHKEQRDLQSRITQKKKSATKKTRKSVNDECVGLERELREKHATEISLLKGESPDHDSGIEEPPAEVTQNLLPGASSGSLENSLESLSFSVPNDSSMQMKKPNRQKARLARRAAEQQASTAQAAKEAVDLPDLRGKERLEMSEEFKARGLREKEVRPDGHCMYSAIADQLTQASISTCLADKDSSNASVPEYKLVRQAAASYIMDHPDDFLPFLEEPLDIYVTKIKDTAEWGGQLELLATAKAYDVNINVLQSGGRVEKIEGVANDPKALLWLVYYRHSFGLGEHYNSLRKAP
ncbi:hypothetical protein MMC20_002440 [Loxospora ochrophaea]|nr:hypothetical protein [Loxospora ochrophaea]